MTRFFEKIVTPARSSRARIFFSQVSPFETTLPKVLREVG